jgi:hypothetical protein
MRRRRILWVLVGSIAMFAIATAFAGTRAIDQTADYRYTGAVENGSGIPTHLARAGQGFAFSFFDALSLGRRSVPYMVCVGRAGKGPVKCWKRTARFGVGKLFLGQTLPPRVPYGALTVRWSLEGRIVAKWRLLYVRGEG